MATFETILIQQGNHTGTEVPEPVARIVADPA